VQFLGFLSRIQKVTSQGKGKWILKPIYDVCSRAYVDAIIQDRNEENEIRACVQMIDWATMTDKNVILMADRGYDIMLNGHY
jgi:hypothetical protein